MAVVVDQSYRHAAAAADRLCHRAAAVAHQSAPAALPLSAAVSLVHPHVVHRRAAQAAVEPAVVDQLAAEQAVAVVLPVAALDAVPALVVPVAVVQQRLQVHLLQKKLVVMHQQLKMHRLLQQTTPLLRKKRLQLMMLPKHSRM